MKHHRLSATLWMVLYMTIKNELVLCVLWLNVFCNGEARLTTATWCGLHVVKDASSYDLPSIVIHPVHVEHHDLFISWRRATGWWQTQSATLMKFLRNYFPSDNKSQLQTATNLHIVFVHELWGTFLKECPGHCSVRCSSDSSWLMDWGQSPSQCQSCWLQCSPNYSFHPQTFSAVVKSEKGHFRCNPSTR